MKIGKRSWGVERVSYYSFGIRHNKGQIIYVKGEGYRLYWYLYVDIGPFIFFSERDYASIKK